MNQQQQTLKIIADFIAEMNSVSTMSGKKAVVKKGLEEHPSEIRNFLKFALDPHIVTGVSKLKNDVEPTFRAWCLDLFILLYYISSNNTGSTQIHSGVLAFCEKYELQDELLDTFINLVTKNIHIGIEAKTLNKIVGKEMIPVWEVQQAYSIDKVKLKAGEKIWLSQKLNGNRCTFCNGVLMSRQGIPFTGLDHIIAQINSLGLASMFLDGELIRKNTDGVSDGENFRIGTGIINSDAESKTEIEFVIFDVLTGEEYRTQQHNPVTKYEQRYNTLLEIKDIIEKNPGADSIRVVPMFYNGTDHSMIDVWLNYAVEHNMEGLMLNRNVPYYFRRHNGILKVKRFYTMDLPVTDAEEGTNRLSGTLGALVVDFKGNKVNVGTGFTREQRDTIWADRENIIGKIIEVKYKETTTDKKTGLESLQFPVFVQFRNDKVEPSYD